MNSCKLCHGTGRWQYDNNHSTVCHLCCKHDQGFWELSEPYQGYAEGYRFCCSAGCGHSLKFNPEEF